MPNISYIISLSSLYITQRASSRIAWNTLQVRDCTHVTSPHKMMKELEEHFDIATAGTNIQSGKSVFDLL